MISNERRWPAQRQPYRQPYYQQPASLSAHPPIHEDLIESREVQIERKHFTLLLKENPRGRFLRIIEGNTGRLNSIIIPISGLGEIKKLLEELQQASDATPPPKEAPPAV